MKIRTKMILSSTAVILLTTLLISVLVFSATRQAMVQHSLDLGEYLSVQLAKNLSNRFNTMEELQFFQYYYSLFSNMLALASADEELNTIQVRRINDSLRRLYYSQRYITGIYVIDSDENLFSVGSATVADVRDLFSEQYLDEVNNRRGKPVWSVGNDGSLVMGRQLISIYTTRELGIIILIIDYEFLNQVIEQNEDGRTGRVVLYDRNNNILPSGFPNIDEVAISYIEQNSMDEKFDFLGEEYIIISAEIPNNDFTLLNILMVRDLGEYTQNLPYTIMAVAFLSILVSILVAISVFRLATKDIRILADGIRSFASGKLTNPIRVRSSDEIGFLTTEFNRMTDEIDSLINDVYNAEINKKNAELNALQFEYSALEAKINPHFIYNTLESINSLAKIKGDDEISEMVCLLGSLLRDNISFSADIITIEQELENIQKYLSIQKLTYGSKFDIEIQLEDDLKKALVPKFILQPLVENAIIHGLLASSEKGLITLHVKADSENLQINIRDNGVGISEDELDRLLDYSVKAENELGTHTKVGVRAVDKRLKILYGDDFGLDIKSQPGEGTQITVKMPLKFTLD